MDTFTSEAMRQRIRAALVQFGLARPRTHWVTLNSHAPLTDETALRRLKRWRVELMRRVHGKKFYLLPESERLEFFGTREFTAAGEPHFHLACSVPSALALKFARIATHRWKAVVPSGTCHVALIDHEPGSPRNVLNYAFKRFEHDSDLSFVDSRLFYRS